MFLQFKLYINTFIQVFGKDIDGSSYGNSFEKPHRALDDLGQDFLVENSGSPQSTLSKENAAFRVVLATEIPAHNSLFGSEKFVWPHLDIKKGSQEAGEDNDANHSTIYDQIPVQKYNFFAPLAKRTPI